MYAIRSYYDDTFFVFKKVKGTDIYKVKPEFVKPEHSQELLDYLSKLYTHFHQHRHTLFHWDDPTDVVDTTRLLNTPNEAHTLIIDRITSYNVCYTKLLRLYISTAFQIKIRFLIIVSAVGKVLRLLMYKDFVSSL